MSDLPISYVERMERTDFGYCLAFLGAPDGTAILPADVSSIDLGVFDLADLSVNIYPVTGMSPTASPAIILDPPAVADGWNSNSQGAGGRNFRHYLKLSDVEGGGTTTIGGHKYRCEYTVNTDAYDGSSGNWGPIKVVQVVTVLPLSSS